MKNLDLYIKAVEILIMCAIEVSIIRYFMAESQKNIREFNKVNDHKSIGKVKAKNGSRTS